MVATEKGTGQILQDYAPTQPNHLTNKEYVDTKTLYLHEYTLSTSAPSISGTAYVYVKLLTNVDTLYTTASTLWAEYKKITSVNVEISNYIVAVGQVGFDYININYTDGTGVGGTSLDMLSATITSSSIVQLN